LRGKDAERTATAIEGGKSHKQAIGGVVPGAVRGTKYLKRRGSGTRSLKATTIKETTDDGP